MSQDDRRRAHCVSAWCTKEELTKIDSQRSVFNVTSGVYLRAMALGTELTAHPIVPELNCEAWKSLARVGSNLNQVSRHLNSHPGVQKDIAAINAILNNVRNGLIGLNPCTRK